jgi:hypothetical protein
VRDLAWACFSPPLLHIEQLAGAASGISSCQLQLTAARRHWLSEIDQHPSSLLEHLARHPTRRLGKYYELLWHFFLQQDPDTELLACNLPVQGEHRTLGEFDCIYYCAQRDCHVHLELAVKYFLGLDTSSTADAGTGARRWLGPDSRDNLEAKQEQLVQRQIVLGDLPVAQPALQALGVSKLAKEIALKGYLFWPWQSELPAPPGYNTACGYHHWLRCDELEAHCTGAGTHSMLILPRMRWLSKAHSPAPVEHLACAELMQSVAGHFSRDPFPLLIAALDRDGNEQHRFFVTPQQWPST